MGKSHITISSSNSLLALSYCHLGCLRSLSFRCKEHCLHPYQSVLFTWDEPSASREFVWFVKGSKERIATDLSQVSTLVVVVVVVDLFTTLAFFSLFFSHFNIYLGYQGPSTRFVWRILSPNHVRSLITKACLVIRDFSKTSVQIENSGLITEMNKKQMRFHLTFNLEKKPCCYRVNLGRLLSTQISFWVQDWNSRQYDSFTLWEIDDAPFSTFC